MLINLDNNLRPYFRFWCGHIDEMKFSQFEFVALFSKRENCSWFTTVVIVANVELRLSWALFKRTVHAKSGL